MNLIPGRLRKWSGTPRFCPDDGNDIEVEKVVRYDRQTGEPREWWCWHCPDVSVRYEGGAITWLQWGVDRVHIHGEGRPSWHRASEVENGPHA